MKNSLHMKSSRQQMLFGAELPPDAAATDQVPEHVQSLIRFHGGCESKRQPAMDKSRVYDESLCALRQKQKQLLQSKHKRLLRNLSGSENNSLDSSDQEGTLVKSRSIQHFSTTSRSNSSNQLYQNDNNNDNSKNEKSKNDYNGSVQSSCKNQLQNYVQSLESKLKSLRVEMDSSFRMAAEHVESTNRKVHQVKPWKLIKKRGCTVSDIRPFYRWIYMSKENWQNKKY